MKYRSQSDISESVLYYDGLGHEIQEQVKMDDTTAVILEKMYDRTGRLVLETKPAAVAVDDFFAYAPDFIEAGYAPGDSMTLARRVYQFYDSNPGPDSHGYPFTYYEYDPDPLDRIRHIHPPGRDFHVEADGHFIEKSYDANTADDGVGTPGSLYAERTRDENGAWSSRWTNVFKEVIAEAIDHPDTDSSLNTIVTGFEYDKLGNLVRVDHPSRSVWGCSTVDKDSVHNDPGDTAYTFVLSTQADSIYFKVTLRIPWSWALTLTGGPNDTCYETRSFEFLLYDTDSTHLDLYSSGDIRHKTDGTTTYWESPEYYGFPLTAEEPQWKVKVVWDGYSTDCDNIPDPREWAYLEKVEYSSGEEPLTTTYGYNSKSQLISMYSPDITRPEEYLYDLNGNLRFVLDPERAEADSFIYYKYDELNRKIEEGLVTGISNFTRTNANDVTYPTGVDHDRRYVFVYDLGENGKGRLYTESSDAQTGNQKRYYYDPQGRVTTIACWIPGLGSADSVNYTYDRQGNVTEIEYPDGSRIALTYNDLNLVEEIADPINGEKYAFYRYWPTGQVKQLVLGSGGALHLGGPSVQKWAQVVDYDYTVRDWLKTINDGRTSINPGGDRFGMELFYTDRAERSYYNGNIAYMKRVISTTPTEFDYEFRYDDANRLIIADCSPDDFDVGGVNDSTIVYDAAGNILRLSRGGTDYEYAYLARTNKLAHISKDMERHAFVYDAGGNVTVDSLKKLEIRYDYRDLPTRFDRWTPGDEGIVACLYDARGDRVRRKSEGVSADSVLTFYIYGQGGEILSEYEKVGTGPVTLKQNYIYGAGGERIARFTSPWFPYYYLNDHLGSSRVIVHKSGTVRWWADHFRELLHQALTPEAQLLCMTTGTVSCLATVKRRSAAEEKTPGQPHFTNAPTHVQGPSVTSIETSSLSTTVEGHSPTIPR